MQKGTKPRIAVRYIGEPGFPAAVLIDGDPLRYLVRAARTPDGPRLIAVQVQAAAGGYIDPAAVKRIPAATLARAAVNADAIFPCDDSAPGTEENPREVSGLAIGATGPYADRFQELAELVRTSRSEGWEGGAGQAVADALNVSKSHAHRVIRQIREAGLLDRERPPSEGYTRQKRQKRNER